MTTSAFSSFTASERGDWPAAVRTFGLAPWPRRSFVAAGWFIDTARVSGVSPVVLMQTFTSIFGVARRRVSSSVAFAEAARWRRVLPSWGLGTFGLAACLSRSCRMGDVGFLCSRWERA